MNGPSQKKKLRFHSFWTLRRTLSLSFLSFFVLFSLLNSRRPGYNLILVPNLSAYRSYRRLHSEFNNDALIRRSIVLPQRLKEIPLCRDLGWNHVPCYAISNHSSASASASVSPSEQLNGHSYGSPRHCPSPLSIRKPCLLPAPPKYKLPLKWPASFAGAWLHNMNFTSDGSLHLSGSSLTRLKLRDDGIVTLEADEESSQLLQSRFERALQRSSSAIAAESQPKRLMVLDINCGFSRKMLSLQLESAMKASILCIAPYEDNGSPVQYSLERGLSALIASSSHQLPLPSFSFDLIHCFDCRANSTWTEGLAILEMDRLLKPGGLFLWDSDSYGMPISNLWRSICWSETEDHMIWKKASNHTCYSSRSPKAMPRLCGKSSEDSENSSTTAYPPLRPCLTNTLFIDNGNQLDKLHGSLSSFSSKEISDELNVWSVTVESYWSLLSPLIFSDHPKRQDEEEKSEPVHSVRNVMDMNAFHGSLNAALLETKKPVWVMNVIPLSAPDTLATIYKRGLLGVRHDWCEAFPTYPRTYDLLHGIGLLSQETERKNGCGMSTLFLEMDRILRPEGWVILRDKSELIEDARIAVSQMRWESRVIEVEGIGDQQQLLVCQKSGRSAKAVL